MKKVITALLAAALLASFGTATALAADLTFVHVVGHDNIVSHL